MRSTENNSLSIIGAGLVGSLLSLYLARQGLKVNLFEARDDLREEITGTGRSINLALSERGIHALKEVDLYNEVMKYALPMKGRMIHTENSKNFQQNYGRANEAIYSVHRGLLNKTLLNAASRSGKVSIHFNHTLESFDLDNGLTIFRDIRTGIHRHYFSQRLIAADGSGSKSRKILAKNQHLKFTIEPLNHGYKELNIPADDTGRHKILNNFLHIWPRGNHMLIALPNTDGSFTATLFLPQSGLQGFEGLANPTEIRAFFHAQFPDTEELIPNLEENFIANPVGKLATVRCDDWFYKDKIALIGDAAHAMVPFHGQGMNCGFEDCSDFNQCMNQSPGDWRRIFTSFQNLRKNNANAIADMALENYLEMRSSVIETKFQLKKEVEKRLQDLHPDVFIPRYSRVMFHRTPYAEVYQKGKIQGEILDELIADITSIESLDLKLAEQLILSKL